MSKTIAEQTRIWFWLAVLVLGTACQQLTGVKPQNNKDSCAGKATAVTDSIWTDSLGQQHTSGHFHLCGWPNK